MEEDKIPELHENVNLSERSSYYSEDWQNGNNNHEFYSLPPIPSREQRTPRMRHFPRTYQLDLNDHLMDRRVAAG